MYKLLSYSLDHETPLYGFTPKIQFAPLRSISKGDTSNTTLITLCTHSGTHIDAPLHFARQGRSITDFGIADFIFHSPLLIHCPKDPGSLVKVQDIMPYEKELSTCDILLIRTDFSRFRGQEIYRTHNPGLCPSLARYIISQFQNIRAIGIDTISVSSYQNRDLGKETHQIFLTDDKDKSSMILVEDLCLDGLDYIEKLFVIPLMLKGLDGSPATVFAQISQ